MASVRGQKDSPNVAHLQMYIGTRNIKCFRHWGDSPPPYETDYVILMRPLLPILALPPLPGEGVGELRGCQAGGGAVVPDVEGCL